MAGQENKNQPDPSEVQIDAALKAFTGGDETQVTALAEKFIQTQDRKSFENLLDKLALLVNNPSTEKQYELMILLSDLEERLSEFSATPSESANIPASQQNLPEAPVLPTVQPTISEKKTVSETEQVTAYISRINAEVLGPLRGNRITVDEAEKRLNRINGGVNNNLKKWSVDNQALVGQNLNQAYEYIRTERARLANSPESIRREPLTYERAVARLEEFENAIDTNIAFIGREELNAELADIRREILAGYRTLNWTDQQKNDILPILERIDVRLSGAAQSSAPTPEAPQPTTPEAAPAVLHDLETALQTIETNLATPGNNPLELNYTVNARGRETQVDAINYLRHFITRLTDFMNGGGMRPELVPDAQQLLRDTQALIERIQTEQIQALPWMVEARTVSAIDANAVPEADVATTLANAQTALNNFDNGLRGLFGTSLQPNSEVVNNLIQEQRRVVQNLTEQLRRRDEEIRAAAPLDNTEREARKNEVIQRIHDRITQIEGTSAPAMTREMDIITRALDPIYALLRDNRAFFDNEDEFNALEVEITLFDYRHTKRVLEAVMFQYEMGEIGSYNDFDNEYYTQVIKTNILNRLEAITVGMRSGRYKDVDADLVNLLDRDYRRVTTELGRRIAVYITSKSLNSIIWWNGKTDAAQARGIPGGPGPAFFATHDLLSEYINASEPINFDPRVNFKDERQLNAELGTRRETMKDFADADRTVEVELTVTEHGEIMRLLDKLYANKLKSKNVPPDFYKTMHLVANRTRIPKIIREAAEEIGINVTESQVKRIFYMHMLFLNHSMLLTSSPNLSDSAYYANQILTYATNETAQDVNIYPFEQVVSLVGRFDEKKLDDDNPEGKRYILDIIGRVPKGKMHKGHGFMGWVAEKLDPVQTVEDATSLRDKMLDALHHHFPGYEYFADMPFMAIHKSPFGTYPVLPLPLQFMVFQDKDATYTKTNDNEKRVKRWQNPNISAVDADHFDQGKPIVAADYVNEAGEILYEKIPWKEVLSDSQLQNWYNNGENILNMLSIFRAEERNEMFNKKELGTDNKKQKYAAVFFPGIGLEALVGRIDHEALFDILNEIRVFARAIYLITDAGKTLHEAEVSLHNLIPKISTEAVGAMIACLKAGFGTVENRERYGKLFASEVRNALRPGTSNGGSGH